MVQQAQSQGSQPEPLGDLSSEVAQLRAEIHVLRESIDEFREVVEWAAQNGKLGSQQQGEIGDLKYPARQSVDLIGDESPLEAPKSPNPVESGATVLEESAKYDAERLNYLFRIMPSRDGYDMESDYFSNLKAYFQAFQIELTYLNNQTRTGHPCESAQETSKRIYDKRMELLRFEKAQEKIRRQQENSSSGVQYTFEGMGHLTESFKSTSDPALEYEEDRDCPPQSRSRYDTFYPWGF